MFSIAGTLSLPCWRAEFQHCLKCKLSTISFGESLVPRFPICCVYIAEFGMEDHALKDINPAVLKSRCRCWQGPVLAKLQGS